VRTVSGRAPHVRRNSTGTVLGGRLDVVGADRLSDTRLEATATGDNHSTGVDPQLHMVSADRAISISTLLVDEKPRFIR